MANELHCRCPDQDPSPQTSFFSAMLCLGCYAHFSTLLHPPFACVGFSFVAVIVCATVPELATATGKGS